MKFNLLEEEVVDSDLFKEKTHDRIADTIAHLICSKKSSITIGLEGSWGAGKSSVISILEKKLAEEGTVKLVRFDSWAHEGDPLRRVFLESLINEIKPNVPSIKDQLDSLLEIISKRTKNVTINTQQYATGFGKLLAISAFVVPLGLSLMSIVKDVTFDIKGSPHLVFLLALFLSSAPLIVIILRLFQLKFKRVMDPNNWAFLEQGSTQKINQEISEDSERSSIEFEKYFEEIMGLYFISSPVNSKIVLVIDNLDRVDEKDALLILSTLQTFLQKRNTTQKEKEFFNKIWIIIPYDQEGLSSLWDEPKIAKSFFDKNFQLRIEVPKPIFSNWLKYANEMVEKALVDCTPEMKNDVSSTLSVTRKDLNDIPTPREIKNYINQVAILLYHTKEYTIPTKSISYYVVLRQLENQTISEIRNGLITSIIPTLRLIPLFPETIKKDISGLIFGVPSDIGYQLLLEPEIEKHLSQGNHDELKKIHDSQRDDFWFVFDQHIRRHTDLENPILFNYAKSINGAFWKDHKSKCEIFIKLSYKTFESNSDKLKFPSIEEQDGCLSLAQMWESNTAQIKTHCNLILESYDKYIESQETLVDSNIEFIDKLFQLNQSLGLLDKQFTLKSLTLNKIIQLHNLSLNKNNISSWLIPTDQIINEIQEQVKPNLAFKGIDSALKYLRLAKYEFDSNKILTLIQAHINHNSGNYNNHSDEVFEIISSLSLSEDTTSEKIKEIITAGPYLNLFFHRKDQNIIIPTAITFAYILRSDIHKTTLQNVNNSANGEQNIRSFWQTSNLEIAETILTYLLPFEKFEFLWSLIEDPSNKLAHDLLNVAIKDYGKFEIFFRSNDCLERLRLADDLKLNSEDLTKAFLKNNNFEEQIISDDNLNIKNYSRQLLDILKTTKNDRIGEYLSQHIPKLTEENWDEEFQGEENLIKLSLEVKLLNSNFSLTVNFHDSLHKFTKNLDGISEWKKENWDSLFKLLSIPYQKEFIENATQYFIANKDKTPILFLELNGKYFNKEKIFKSPKLYESTVANLIEQGDFNKLKIFINTFSSDDTKRLLKIDDNKKEIVSDRINKLTPEAKKENEELLKSIGDVFNI